MLDHIIFFFWFSEDFYVFADYKGIILLILGNNDFFTIISVINPFNTLIFGQENIDIVFKNKKLTQLHILY